MGIYSQKKVLRALSQTKLIVYKYLIVFMIVQFLYMTGSPRLAYSQSQQDTTVNVSKRHTKDTKSHMQKVLNFKSKKGIGLVQTISGVSGLGIHLGMGRLFLLETILGASVAKHESFRSEFLITSSLGIHFQLIQAKDVVSLTSGIRYNHIFGETCSQQTNNCIQGSANPKGISEALWDIPLRIMWFPIRYLSIHTEFGTTIYQDSIQTGYVDVAQERVTKSTGSWKIDFFRQENIFGKLGISFWFK